MEKVFEIYIKTTPERLWEAITDASCGEVHFGVGIDSDWTPDRATRRHPGAASRSRGREPRGRPAAPPGPELHALWSDDVKAEGTSRVTWEIEPVGDSCRLTVTHDQLREGANDELYGGWPMILSGLKTLLESGELLDTPARCATRAPPPTRPDLGGVTCARSRA
jgi:uncharacterized protein YndB with AHSA1/START domain